MGQRHSSKNKSPDELPTVQPHQVVKIVYEDLSDNEASDTSEEKGSNVDVSSNKITSTEDECVLETREVGVGSDELLEECGAKSTGIQADSEVHTTDEADGLKPGKRVHHPGIPPKFPYPRKCSAPSSESRNQVESIKRHGIKFKKRNICHHILYNFPDDSSNSDEAFYCQTNYRRPKRSQENLAEDYSFNAARRVDKGDETFDILSNQWNMAPTSNMRPSDLTQHAQSVDGSEKLRTDFLLASWSDISMQDEDDSPDDVVDTWYSRPARFYLTNTCPPCNVSMASGAPGIRRGNAESLTILSIEADKQTQEKSPQRPVTADPGRSQFYADCVEFLRNDTFVKLRKQCNSLCKSDLFFGGNSTNSSPPRKNCNPPNHTSEVPSQAATDLNKSCKLFNYQFWIPNEPWIERAFKNYQTDRRIESIGRLSDCRIRLTDRRRRSARGFSQRLVNIVGPNEVSLRKCCKLFDDKFPQFHATAGLQPSIEKFLQSPERSHANGGKQISPRWIRTTDRQTHSIPNYFESSMRFGQWKHPWRNPYPMNSFVSLA